MPPQINLIVLKDFIMDLLEKKEAHDFQSMESAVPLTTLDKFLFVHLSEKFGSRNVVV